MDRQNLASFLLRIGIACVLLYAAVASLLDSTSWIGFLPQWSRNLIPAAILLTIFSIFEIALALLLLSGKRPKEAAVISALTLAAITIANIGVFDIVFRDVGLLFSAFALVALHWEKS